jgi:hypothetical protein
VAVVPSGLFCSLTPLAIFRLERFSICLNRVGFPNLAGSDSNSLPDQEVAEMSKALSVDLRDRVLSALSASASHREAVKRFEVSTARVGRWRILMKRTGHVCPDSLGGRVSGISCTGEHGQEPVCHSLHGSLPSREGVSIVQPHARIRNS